MLKDFFWIRRKEGTIEDIWKDFNDLCLCTGGDKQLFPEPYSDSVAPTLTCATLSVTCVRKPCLFFFFPFSMRYSMQLPFSEERQHIHSPLPFYYLPGSAILEDKGKSPS